MRTTITLGVLVVGAACTAGEPEADPAASPSRTATVEESPAASDAADSEAFTGAWVDRTQRALGTTGDWTNKVEAADLDTDGDVDLLFANGGDYETPGDPVPSRVFLNDGAGAFTDATRRVLGATKQITRVIKVVDVDADGHRDILLGTTYGSQSRLFAGRADGTWRDVTRQRLPRTELSVGDLEAGDVDADGDLDLVLADWGEGSPMSNQGGRVRLWVNDGAGFFSDATRRMPTTLVGFSWDLELVDVDNDWDLDVAVSCKTCPGSYLYLNDGTGTYDDVSADRMPQFTNNYDFAPIDLDGDGYLDLVTINDGDETAYGLAEHVFRNDQGTFVDVTDDWWPSEANQGWDDNAIAPLDVESDGDADFLVASLDGPDRLLVNDGDGRLSLHDDVFDTSPSGGTLGMVVADLNGDGRPDVAEGQGEVTGHEDERVYLGTEVLDPDSAAPVVAAERGDGTIVARIHDNRAPNMPHDWQQVIARWAAADRPMSWYGENLFRTEVPDDATGVEVCATDAAGNESCDDAE